MFETYLSINDEMKPIKEIYGNFNGQIKQIKEVYIGDKNNNIKTVYLYTPSYNPLPGTVVWKKFIAKEVNSFIEIDDETIGTIFDNVLVTPDLFCYKNYKFDSDIGYYPVTEAQAPRKDYYIIYPNEVTKIIGVYPDYSQINADKYSSTLMKKAQKPYYIPDDINSYNLIEYFKNQIPEADKNPKVLYKNYNDETGEYDYALRFPNSNQVCFYQKGIAL